MMALSNKSTWWGKHEIPQGETGRWTIGSLAFTACWQSPEWRFIHDRGTTGVDGGAAGIDDGVGTVAPTDPEVADPVTAGTVEDTGKDTLETLRVMSTEAGGSVSLTPVPADRPVVARPETAILVLPGAKVRLYVSTPVWIRVEVGDPPLQVLDLPSWRLSDTWFGPSTKAGELCYAVRTSARVHRENLPDPVYRAVSEVILENKALENFSLDRLSLPAPNLSLYTDAENQLWTQTITVRIRGQDTLAEIELGKGPPADAREPRLLSAPRIALSRNILERAMSALF